MFQAKRVQEDQILPSIVEFLASKALIALRRMRKLFIPDATKKYGRHGRTHGLCIRKNLGNPRLEGGMHETALTDICDWIAVIDPIRDWDYPVFKDRVGR
ncbi:hypothetical protein AD930_06535 [Acetobacter malorum]|nr:hypothetical protein AD930_06535 [Acetobacter malorum]